MPDIPEINSIINACGEYTQMWYAPTAMALVLVGAVLGLVGSSMAERKGKIFLASAGILMILSAVIFVVGLSSDAEELLFTNRSIAFMGAKIKFSTYFSLGFLQALAAAVLAFFSLATEPRSPVMPRLKMRRIEVWLLTVFMILLYTSIVVAMLFPEVKLYYSAERYIPMLSISVALILADFSIALIIAIAASLGLREEEEEKTMPVTKS